MKGNRAFRRKHRRKENSSKSKITKRDKIGAFLTIGGIFLIAVFLAVWLALPNIFGSFFEDDTSAQETTAKGKEQLPILGSKNIVRNGEDTVYHTIPEFTFVNQDSIAVTPKTFEDKIYIADFFFTSCTTICPVMKNEMQRKFRCCFFIAQYRSWA